MSTMDPKKKDGDSLLAKAAAMMPFGGIADAMEAGKKKPADQESAESARRAAEVEDQQPFAALNSERAWSTRKSEAEDHAEKVRDKRGSVRRDPTEKRLKKYMDGLADKMPGGKETAEKLKPLTPLLAILLQVLYYAAKYISMGTEVFFVVWNQLPETLIRVIYGLALSFFGGTFVLGIAGIEAFIAAGWRRAYYSSLVIYDDSRHVGYALELDDYEDKDRDGVADVDQISGSDLVQRKTLLAFQTVKKPEELQVAIANVWAAYLAVLATLKFQFARTTAFALAIAASLQFFFLKALGPPLGWLLPKEMGHWVPVLIDTFVHAIALIFAWTLQQIVSAVTSGLRGGMLASRSFIDYTNSRGWSKLEDDATILDEMAGVAIAAAGIWFQLSNWFKLPFPWNILLGPVIIFEWYLRWQVTFSSDATPFGGKK